MAKAHSMDLRERVVAAALGGEGTRAEVARRFSIGVATLYGWLRLVKATGSAAPRPHGGGRELSVSPKGREVLRALVKAENDRTLAEYAALYRERTGKGVSRSVLDRTLRELEITRKKRLSKPASAHATRSAGRG